MAEQQSIIRLANESMTIIEACNELGMDIADFSIASLKTYCPFGHLTHADEGRSKAMRIYPESNSAWCFDCQIYFTPVRMLAMDKGIPEEQMAELILEKKNYIPPDYASRWDALVAPVETVSTDDLAEALKTFCARLDPNWEQRQFEDRVAERLSACLRLLPKVKTAESATKWLTTTKQVMRQELGE